MLTTRQKNKIYDSIHKGWVTSCIAVALASSVYIGYQLYHYITKVRPIKQELEDRFREELLKEGRMMREDAKISTN